MAFLTTQPVNPEAVLIDIDHESVPTEYGPDGMIVKPGVPKDPAIAIFSDKSQLEFPKGVKFVPDNHTEPQSSNVVQMRMRASRYVEGQIAPVVSLLIPVYCSRQYILACIERLKKGV